jgi:adenylate cyclase
MEPGLPADVALVKAVLCVQPRVSTPVIGRCRLMQKGCVRARMSKPALTVQRRLAAIFCADVAAYTSLMNADEVGTLRLLSSHREMTDRLIAQHGGRIANTAGDSILAEFPSVVGALQCALGIQERIAAMHEEVPEERRVSFRIGLHVGEVIVRNGDLFGDGVNVAARMQGVAQPGTVCLSEPAYQYAHRVVPIVFEDFGLQSVKNLDLPIRAFLARPAGQQPLALPPVHRIHEIYLLRRLFDIMFKAIREAEKTVGLEFLDAPILASLEDTPGIDQRELAKWLALDIKKVRQIVKRLEQRGLIVKVSSGLALTEAGREIRERLRPVATAAEDRVMAPLSEPEREMFQNLAARMIKANEATNRG